MSSTLPSLEALRVVHASLDALLRHPPVIRRAPPPIDGPGPERDYSGAPSVVRVHRDLDDLLDRVQRGPR